MNTAIQHFSMRFQSEKGEAAYPFSVRIDREQNTKSIAHYKVEDGQLLVGITSRPNTMLLAREALGNRDCADKAMWDLPDERDVKVPGKSEVKTVIEKCLPSIGTQATSLTIQAVDVKPGSQLEGIEFVGAQDIVDRSFRGQPVSFDLVLSVFSLAHDLGLPLKMPIVPTAESRGSVYQTVDALNVTAEEMELWRKETGSKTALSLVPIDAPEKPFIRGIFVNDDARNEEVEIAYRKGSDAVDVGAYVWHSGRIYLPVKIGSRPAKVLMDEFKDRQYSWCDVSGVAGSVEPHETDLDLQMRALVETEEELGMLAAAAPMKVGAFFSLPKSATEKVTSFLCEINPDSVSNRTQGADETVSLRFIELDALLDAFRAGQIQDGRFVLSAMMIKQALHYHDPYKADISGMEGTIAVLGGTFDPLQSAHMKIATTTLQNGDADSVLIIPAKQNKLKHWKPILNDEDRLATTLAAASSAPGVFVSDIELKGQGDYSLTVDTISALKDQKDPDSKLVFIMGSDLLSTLHQWDRVDELFKLLDGVIVYERDGFSFEDFSTIEDLLSEEIILKLKKGWRGGEVMPHSSTDIRRSLSLGKMEEVRDNVPEAVFDYLKKGDGHLFRSDGAR